MSQRSGRTEDLWVAPGCNLACAVCDCRNERSHFVERTLDSGGSRLELRGEAATISGLGEIVARAHAGGWAKVAVRTNATAFSSPERARMLRDTGIDEVVLFLAADRPSVNDAIARVRGARAAFVRGAGMLSDAGLPSSLEIPVLSPKVQDLVATIAIARSASPRAARLRLFSPVSLWEGAGPPPPELLPPRWSDARTSVARAIAHAEDAGLEVTLGERDGVPLCGALERDEARPILRERDQRPMTRGAASRLGARCGACSARASCPGVTDLYLRVHGDEGLEPRTVGSRELVRQRARPDAVWTDQRRESARARYMFVLRPTVDCNQDCWFCSANETSQNVERDAARMSRKILRLARAGVRHLSFSGGEPTLSRHLVEHVALAREAGIAAVELVTNAVLLDREEKVAAYARAGVTHLFVSLHGHDEETSRMQTRKVGDHARTTRALRLFAEQTSVVIRLNHVISARNYRSLVRFVEWTSEQFGTRVSISFAYLTPQYKALERLGDVLPAYRDVAPYLQKALARASELGIECVVGSRQGTPPCVLGDFAIFSDITGLSLNAAAEDAPQKVKGARCGECRFDGVCAGVFRGYADLHGTMELVPIPGEKISPHEDLATALGVRALPESASLAVAPEPATRRSLPVLVEEPVIVIGSGTRAIRMVQACADAGLRVVGIASPHAIDKELAEVPPEVIRAPNLSELLPRVSARGVIVASSTSDHAASARAALAAGLPVLVEKPLAADSAAARALVEDGGERLSVAHQMRMAPGFQELLAETHNAPRLDLRIRRRLNARSADTLHAWSRGQLFELLIHLADLAIATHGVELTVESARGSGASRPESFELKLRSLRGSIVIGCDFAAVDDALEVEASMARRRVLWSRIAGDDALTTTDELGARSRSVGRGSDLSRLLAAWKLSLQGGVPPIRGSEGEAAMRLASESIVQLEASGVPFDRVGAPRHASSRELRERYD